MDQTQTMNHRAPATAMSIAGLAREHVPRAGRRWVSQQRRGTRAVGEKGEGVAGDGYWPPLRETQEPLMNSPPRC